MLNIPLCYTGQRRSRLTSQYLLGSGYRGFNPVIKRFASHDTMSPFGAGGTHGFAYCSGDPANQTDLSGHGPLLDLLFMLVAANPRRLEEVGAVEADVGSQASIGSRAVLDEVARNAGVRIERSADSLVAIGESVGGELTADDAGKYVENIVDMLTEEINGDLRITRKQGIFSRTFRDSRSGWLNSFHLGAIRHDGYHIVGFSGYRSVGQRLIAGVKMFLDPSRTKGLLEILERNIGEALRHPGNTLHGDIAREVAEPEPGSTGRRAMLVRFMRGLFE